MEIRGKNALVTGAARGIGQATAIMLAERGAAKVVIADIDSAALGETAAAVETAGAASIVKVVDLSIAEEVLRLFEEADAESGGLDIVHNNAGIMSGEPDFPDTNVERMIAVIRVNLLAMMIGTRQAVELMRRRGAPGVIVNTASVAAFGPMPADPAYSTSKAGIVNFTQSCQPLHEAFGIRVMAVCPGITDTAIVPKNAEWLQGALQAVKMLTPKDIAETVCTVIGDDTQAGEYVMVQNEQVAAS
jgi:3-oxoacyl-[acyl-carrier protein] reductase